MGSLITININFLVPFRDFHLVSQDYLIDKSFLENWTLGRIKVPDFIDRDEMKDWILALDFIVRSESFSISGPTYPYYRAIRDETFYTKSFSFEDFKGNGFIVPERNYYNENAQPLDLLDTKILYDYLRDYSDVSLSIDTYGQCSASTIIEGRFLFEELRMCGIVEYLLSSFRANYMPPEDQLLFGVKTDNYCLEDDFDETSAFWTFENVSENNQVLIIEFKYLDSKKEEQFEFFNSWRMWHEKFIYNNVMYFVLFQTDEIDNEDITDYFGPLVKALSKRYRINSHQLERKSYYEFKLNHRQANLGEKKTL